MGAFVVQPTKEQYMARIIRTRFEDSTCKRCGRQLAKGELCHYAKPIGVWCITQCKEFPEPTGDLKVVIDKLTKLEGEDRLKGFTLGLLERYRVTGELSHAQIDCLISRKDKQ